jgi:hypothetical protein
MAVNEINEAGRIGTRKRDGRDQARLRSYRAGAQGAALKAKPASPGNR